MRRVLRRGAMAILAASAVLGSFVATALANEQQVVVQVDGVTVDSASNVLVDGKTYVDLAAFSATTGIAYTYDDAAKTAVVNGNTLNVVTVGGKPAAGVRELAAAAGYAGVSWNAANLTANIVSKQHLVVYGDVVSHLLGCVPTNRFQIGDSIIFRMRAVDPVTGQMAEDAKLQVRLATGEVLDMELGEHPPGVPGADRFWTVAYHITEDTPLGLLRYTVTAETETAAGSFEPFNVMPSLITIVPAEGAEN